MVFLKLPEVKKFDVVKNTTLPEVKKFDVVKNTTHIYEIVKKFKISKNL